ncbi:hypothetical protein [Nostoc sp. C110]|uniref:hypothetical protein n=1 Tax=Nostoc sp. C110 TaxID=3349876 RepID=UPI00370D9C88
MPISIAAESPRRVAEVLAEIWQGMAVQCSHTFPTSSYIAFAGDEYGKLFLRFLIKTAILFL